MVEELKIVTIYARRNRPLAYDVMWEDGSIIAVRDGILVNAVKEGRYNLVNATITDVGFIQIHGDVPMVDMNRKLKNYNPFYSCGYENKVSDHECLRLFFGGRV